MYARLIVIDRWNGAPDAPTRNPHRRRDHRRRPHRAAHLHAQRCAHRTTVKPVRYFRALAIGVLVGVSSVLVSIAGSSITPIHLH